jgi:hypothetical protein
MCLCPTIVILDNILSPNSTDIYTHKFNQILQRNIFFNKYFYALSTIQSSQSANNRALIVKKNTANLV